MIKDKKHTIVGTLKKMVISYPFFDVSKDRTCRVYLPSDYDAKREEPHKVLYLLDGQNVFDTFTSSYNQEWRVDETIEEKLAEGYPSMIVVGIYNSRKRIEEYTPRFDCVEKTVTFEGMDFNPQGENTADYVINYVIPRIEKEFNCGRSKEKRLFGGSSAGGNMATFMACAYPDYFQYFLSFSTAFHLYRKVLKTEKVFNYVVSTFLDKKHRNKFSYILTAGGCGQEAEYFPYVEQMKARLIEGGFNEELLVGLIDKKFDHNEKQWAFFFNKIYSFIAR